MSVSLIGAGIAALVLMFCVVVYVAMSSGEGVDAEDKAFSEGMAMTAAQFGVLAVAATFVFGVWALVEAIA